MMNSAINTDNVNASVEIPTLDATLSTNTLIGESSARSLSGVSNVNTLIGSIGNGVIGSGIKSIYVNNHEQSVSNDVAYITLTYDMIYNLPTIPTKTSDLINDSGFINSGYVTTSEFTSLSNQVGTIENNITTINNEIEETQTDIEEINEELTNKVNQTDFDNLVTQVTTNTNNIATNTTNIGTNTNNISLLQTLVDAQAQTLSSATSIIEQNSDDIDALETDVTNINTALNDKVNTTAFNALDAQVQTNTNAIAGKQDTLVSGTNIKTINSQSLLGSGDITITGGQATDVQINGTSITSNNTANILTNSTYNENTNKIATMNDLPVIPSIPTKTSDLTNDSGFITNTVNNLTNYTLTSNLATVATSGNYNDLSNLPTIPTVPTNVSAFTNDAGYITNTVNDLTNYTLTSNLATVATSGSYNDLTNIPTIPTATSQLTNDSGFITNTDYATSSTGGVIKTGTYGSALNGSGVLYAQNINYSNYSSTANNTFISKGTLENVLSAYGLTPYKNGDTMTMSARYYCNATITSGSKDIIFCVPVNKSMMNVTPTLTSIAFSGRTTNGGYLNNSSNDITNTTSGYTFTLVKTGDWFVRITCTKSTAFSNVTNNTPVAINVIYTFSFS